MPKRQGMANNKNVLTRRVELLQLHCLSQVYVLKTVFRRSQHPFWSFSLTRVTNLALSNSFFLLFVAERNGACTTRLSLSAMLPECQQTEQVAGMRASIPRSRNMHLISVRQSKLRLAPPLWFCGINTSRNFS